MSGDAGGLAGVTGEQYRSSRDALRRNLSMNSAARLSMSASPGLSVFEWTTDGGVSVGVLAAVWKLGDPASSSSSSVQSSRLGGRRRQGVDSDGGGDGRR